MNDRRAVADALERTARLEEWTRICPPSYRVCEADKLPSNAARVARNTALTWTPEDGGLGIIGRESGQGKTRIAFAAAHRHFMLGGTVQAMLSGQFGTQCAGKYDNQLDDWISPWRRVRILILDDLGKDRPNERVSAALFSIIEHRCAYLRPILFTSNYDGEELATRFGDHGPYIVRRLREFCQMITV